MVATPEWYEADRTGIDRKIHDYVLAEGGKDVHAQHLSHLASTAFESYISIAKTFGYQPCDAAEVLWIALDNTRRIVRERREAKKL